MYKASTNIELFDLHDGPVHAISIEGTAITLELEFAIIGRDHPANPCPSAQYIKPCTLQFQGVSLHSTNVWVESTRSFAPHPCTSSPIEGDVIEFEPVASGEGYSVKLAGFHTAGWSEWQFSCTSVFVSWAEFGGEAWYES